MMDREDRGGLTEARERELRRRLKEEADAALFSGLAFDAPLRAEIRRRAGLGRSGRRRVPSWLGWAAVTAGAAAVLAFAVAERGPLTQPARPTPMAAEAGLPEAAVSNRAAAAAPARGGPEADRARAEHLAVGASTTVDGLTLTVDDILLTERETRVAFRIAGARAPASFDLFLVVDGERRASLDLRYRETGGEIAGEAVFKPGSLPARSLALEMRGFSGRIEGRPVAAAGPWRVGIFEKSR